jgi:hypothetical protein
MHSYLRFARELSQRRARLNVCRHEADPPPSEAAYNPQLSAIIRDVEMVMDPMSIPTPPRPEDNREAGWVDTQAPFS